MNLPDLPRIVAVSSNVKRGDVGFYLVAALAMTLHASGRLGRFSLSTPDPLFKDLNPVLEPSAVDFLALEDVSMGQYSDDLLYPLYCLVQGGKSVQPMALNLWIRAWSRGANTFMNVHSRCLGSEVLVSLVERGGDILTALRL